LYSVCGTCFLLMLLTTNNMFVKAFLIALAFIQALTIVYIFWSLEKNIKGLIVGIVIAFGATFIRIIVRKFGRN
jgi:hypothetical protein